MLLPLASNLPTCKNKMLLKFSDIEMQNYNKQRRTWQGRQFMKGGAESFRTSINNKDDIQVVEYVLSKQNIIGPVATQGHTFWHDTHSC